MGVTSQENENNRIRDHQSSHLIRHSEVVARDVPVEVAALAEMIGTNIFKI